MNNETFRDIRNYKQMTMRQFASWLGVSLSTVCEIENGNRNVSHYVKAKLAHKFDITDDFLQFRERKSKLIN